MINHRARNQSSLALTVLAAVAVVTAGCANGGAAPPPASGATADIARLQRETGLLERQLELAGGKSFYLVLDPASSDLTLMLRGAELQRYSVLGLQVGRSRVVWATAEDPPPWQDVIWSNGELDPPRQIDRLVVEGAPGASDGKEPEAPQIPPTPEELYPVPARYHVRFEEGRSIEIRPLEADAQAGRLTRVRAWLSTRWHDAVAAAFERDSDDVRIRVALNPGDAASLYRSLPPAVHLIILSSGSSAPAPAAKTAPVGAPAAEKGGD